MGQRNLERDRTLTGARREQTADLKRISAQLDDLRRLAIMQLLVLGAQSSHIAEALGIGPSAISNMMPVRDIQKAAAPRRTED
jgi:DNA-directed RNA polymerase specialized sigma24 family protein